MKRKMKKIVNEVKLISFIIMYWVLKEKWTYRKNIYVYIPDENKKCTLDMWYGCGLCAGGSIAGEGRGAGIRQV